MDTLKSKTERSPGNIPAVRETIERSPHRSSRRHCVSLGLSEARLRRILHKELHFYPYIIQVSHALHERDYLNRVNSCGDLTLSNPIFVTCILRSSYLF
jgi:hypothetical protein